MNTKKKVFSGLFLLLLVSLVYIGTAFNLDVPSEGALVGYGIADGQNISKNVNLSAVFLDAAANAANWSIENVTFIFHLTSNGSTWNVSFSNTTTNQSRWGNFSGGVVYNLTGTSQFAVGIDLSNATSLMPDGVYNISIYYCANTSFTTFVCRMNDTVAQTVTIDSTVPAVSPITLAGSSIYSMSTVNVTFNVSIKDLSIQSAADAQQPGLVNLRFDNGSGVEFNRSLNNLSGHWSASYNVSALVGGYHTVTIVVNDTAKNVSGYANTNKTETFSFLVNQAQNVTWDPTYGTATWGLSLKGATNVSALRTPGGVYGLTDAAYTFLDNLNRTQFNLTVQNATANQIWSQYVKVIFMFNNGTDNQAFQGTATNGTAYNITANASLTPLNTSMASIAAYMANITAVNLSYHRAGLNEVCAFVNDSHGHFNKTECITFELNTAPNVTWPMYNGLAGDVAQYGKLQGQNFSASNTTIYFNASVKKLLEGGNGINISNVIFMFDNATGNDFNVTNASRPIGLGPGQQLFNASYNVSALAEGTHTVTLFTNDYFANVNKTEVITFKVDKTGPSITVTCTSNPTSGSTVTCTCAAEDSLSGVKDTGLFQGDTDNSESTTAAGTGGTSSTCTAFDWAGNRGTGTGSWTVTAAASSGSGGSGGGGGGATTTTTEPAAEATTETSEQITEEAAPSEAAPVIESASVISVPQSVELVSTSSGAVAGQASSGGSQEVREVTVAVKEDVPITFRAATSTKDEVEHTLTVEEVTETSATLTITSATYRGATGSAVDVLGEGSLQLTLLVGESQEVDSDGDSISDLLVKLNGVNPAEQYADVTVTSLITQGATSGALVVAIVLVVVLVLGGAYWMMKKK